MIKKSEELEIAIQAAKVGAKVGLKYFDKPIQVQIKEDKTVVTHADFEAENAIKKFILSKDSTAEFLAEESGNQTHSNTFWIIDPIDGTRCYVRGIPFWCSLVTYVENGEVKLTCCYFPLVKNGLLYGERNKGAFCEDKKIHVSSVSNFESAYLTFGSIRHFKDKNQLLRVVDKINGVRGYEPTYGSALLVQGKVDIQIDVFAYAWDSAPFKVLVEEAGGKITHPDGSSWNLSGRGIVATNGLLHDEVIKLYNQ